MSATTAYKEKAQHVENLLRVNSNLTEEELAEASGISVTSARRIKKAFGRGVSMGDLAPDETSGDDSALPMDFEESPHPIGDEPEQKNIVQEGLKKIRATLGMTSPDEKAQQEQTTKTPVAVKLTKRQQEFVKNFAPILAAGFTMSMAWVWGHVGAEYTALAPDEETSRKICEPLVRIYARHSTFVSSMSPDQIDIFESAFALIAYGHMSYMQYQRIRSEKEANQHEYERTYEHGYMGEAEARVNGRERANGNHTAGRNAFFESLTRADETNGESVRNERIEHSNLTAKQQAEQAALSRLSELDYQSRLRRSGNVQ